MGNITPESIVNDLRYLQLLSRSFPTIADASTEIINLEAILNLPKGTEHFLTDIHGEYEAFQHVLKNASGAVKRKVNEIFGHTLRESEKKEICTLIYYPEEKLQLIKEQETDLDDWYLITLNQLVKVCQNVSSKYTRSKVRLALPELERDAPGNRRCRHALRSGGQRHGHQRRAGPFGKPAQSAGLGRRIHP